MSRQVQAVDWEGGLSSAWSSVIEWVPKLVLFVIILAIGWIIAKAVAKLVRTLLPKVGFDRVTQRSGIDRFFSPQFGLIELLAKVLYYIILLLALQLALGVFGPNALTNIVNDIVAWLPRLVVAILIVVIAAAIANAVREILAGALGGLSYGGMLARIASIFIIALGVIAALNQVGIATSVTLPVLITVLATVGGILIVGVGGGLIAPMRHRWEGWLGQLEQDTAAAKQYNQQRAAASPQQGEYADQGAYADQGGYPQQADYPQQGAYPQGGYSDQGYPQQGGYADPERDTGYPGQGGYPPQH